MLFIDQPKTPSTAQRYDGQRLSNPDGQIMSRENWADSILHNNSLVTYFDQRCMYVDWLIGLGFFSIER